MVNTDGMHPTTLPIGGIMIVILVLIAVVGVITYLSYAWTERDEHKKSNMYCGLVISGVFAAAIIVITWAVSYNTYIDLRKKLSVVEQYKESIELYADKGVQEFKPGALSSKEFTDLKYNNYQTQIGQMIRDMRDTIVAYNKGYTSKRVMKDGVVYNWLIYLPDDLKPIKMGDYLN